jgi:DMSO/TMAO reductase YedYZ molybdopterin-dependent catalytic subunit
MKTKCLILWLSAFCFFNAMTASATTNINITGLVKQPLSLGIEDLGRFQTVKVQLNDVMRDKTYRGTFYYQGVTLRALLDTASIEQKGKSNSKNISLAIKVTNKEGKSVVLSWGEIYYRNSGDIIIATSATPIMPHKSCVTCHKDEKFYKPYLDVFNRNIEYPKLVVGSDGYGERSIEGVVSIEVVGPSQNEVSKEGEHASSSSTKLFSPSFSITGLVKKEMTLTDLSKYPRKELRMVHMGEGKGFHGIMDFSGTTIKALLGEAGVDNDLTSVFIVSAPDGYRSLFSYGEVFLNRGDDSLIMADKLNGKAIEEEGKFFLAPCDDIMSDRDVKSVEKIEVLSLK